MPAWCTNSCPMMNTDAAGVIAEMVIRRVPARRMLRVSGAATLAIERSAFNPSSSRYPTRSKPQPIHGIGRRAKPARRATLPPAAPARA